MGGETAFILFLGTMERIAKNSERSITQSSWKIPSVNSVPSVPCSAEHKSHTGLKFIWRCPGKKKLCLQTVFGFKLQLNSSLNLQLAGLPSTHMCTHTHTHTHIYWFCFFGEPNIALNSSPALGPFLILFHSIIPTIQSEVYKSNLITLLPQEVPISGPLSAPQVTPSFPM